MNTKNKKFRPELTSAGIEASYPVTVFDEFGRTRDTHITGEKQIPDTIQESASPVLEAQEEGKIKNLQNQKL